MNQPVSFIYEYEKDTIDCGRTAHTTRHSLYRSSSWPGEQVPSKVRVTGGQELIALTTGIPIPN